MEPLNRRLCRLVSSQSLKKAIPLQMKNKKEMKKVIIILTTLCMAVALPCFGQTDTTFTKAEHYKTGKFEAAIFPANYDDYRFSKGKQRFTPTRKEIDQAETALKNDLRSLNKNLINQSSSPIIHKKLSRYKRQYFGYTDENGDRMLFINCFWNKTIDSFLDGIIIMLDGGSYYWSVKFNLTKGELFDLMINGYA